MRGQRERRWDLWRNGVVELADNLHVLQQEQTNRLLVEICCPTLYPTHLFCVY